ncbi:MAG TPA: class E sortase [Acidimicrobiales bacterium]|nr:class E sortase [Acidimicrobiales bacterium]
MTTGRRRAPLAVLAAVLAATSLGLAGWSLRAGDGSSGRSAPGGAAVATAPVPVPETSTTVTAPVALAQLPQPEDSPADARAETPDVVHGTLSLPTLGVTQELHEGVTLTAIDRGPSHWPGTALPGQLGNVVVAGHRTTHSKPFYDLDLLVPGDPLVFTMNDGTVWTYELTATEIVSPDDMHIVDQTPEHRATLFACHPKGSAQQRIVAHFRLVA